jgi:cytochrome c oxidase assembly protein Cox11
VILGVMMKYIAFTFAFVALFLCSCRNNQAGVVQSSDAQTEDTLRTITKEMAFEGVNNYCHKEYDWSVAEDNPDIMYLTMGEETDSTYQVVFRSYTGAFVHFYVNKASGTTRMVEKVPNLNVEEESGTIDLFDYLEKQK